MTMNLLHDCAGPPPFGPMSHGQKSCMHGIYQSQRFLNSVVAELLATASDPVSEAKLLFYASADLYRKLYCMHGYIPGSSHG